MFSPNTGKYRPEKTPHLDISRTVVHYWDQEYNAANIILFSTNQIADILYVSNKTIGITKWYS